MSESLENELPVGTVTEIEIYKNQKKLVCEVMGVLDHDSAIPVVMNYADVPELGHLAGWIHCFLQWNRCNHGRGYGCEFPDRA